MTDPLDPSTEPGSFRPDAAGAGLPRISKRILAIIFGAVVVVLTVLVFSILERAERQEGAEPAAFADSGAPAAPQDPALPASATVPGYDTVQAEIEPAPAPPPAPVADALFFDEPIVDERQERIIRERDQLFRDAMFARTSISASPAPSPGGGPDGPLPPDLAFPQPLAAPAAAIPAADGDARPDPNLRARKDAFADADPSPDPSKIYARAPSRSADAELRPGTIIPALLITGINTDLPGQLLAQVSLDVRDSLTGDRVLIPRGSRLVGTYDSHVAFGQRRALIVWSQIQLPDGSTVPIRNMPGVDPSGRAGFSDRVNNHYLRTFTGATMLSVISAGAQLSQPDRRHLDQTGRQITAEEQLAADLGRQWAEVGSELVNRNLDVQPSLTIRPGYRFRVVVTRDLVIPPWTS